VEAVEVEKVLPITTTKEKRMRLASETLSSTEFLMNPHACLKPSSVFIGDVRPLMKEMPEQSPSGSTAGWGCWSGRRSGRAASEGGICDV
jgi:hypothetical protein